VSAQTDLYDSIYNDVVELTKRPDLDSETVIAVRTATLSIHMRQSFPRDVSTQLAKLPNVVYSVALDVQVLFPRMRGISTCRVTDISFAPLETPRIDVVELGDIYDNEYGTLKDNIAYQAGSSLNVRCNNGFYGVLLEYFQLPLVRREQYNSWIAMLAPDVIVVQAAANVFRTNGNEEKAKGYEAQVNNVLFPELVSNFLTTAQR
jgi:hypothetical protein